MVCAAGLGAVTADAAPHMDGVPQATDHLAEEGTAVDTVVGVNSTARPRTRTTTGRTTEIPVGGASGRLLDRSVRSAKSGTRNWASRPICLPFKDFGLPSLSLCLGIFGAVQFGEIEDCPLSVFLTVRVAALGSRPLGGEVGGRPGRNLRTLLLCGFGVKFALQWAIRVSTGGRGKSIGSGKQRQFSTPFPQI